MGFAENFLLLGFGKVRVAVHGGGIARQGQTEADGDVVEVHNDSPFVKASPPGEAVTAGDG